MDAECGVTGKGDDGKKKEEERKKEKKEEEEKKKKEQTHRTITRRQEWECRTFPVRTTYLPGKRRPVLHTSSTLVPTILQYHIFLGQKHYAFSRLILNCSHDRRDHVRFSVSLDKQLELLDIPHPFLIARINTSLRLSSPSADILAPGTCLCPQVYRSRQK